MPKSKFTGYYLYEEYKLAHSIEEKEEYEDKMRLLTERLKEAGVYANGEGGELKFITSKIKDEGYKKIQGSIKKNYDDAMKKLKKIDKELYSHFSKHIKKEGGAFIYTPPDNIDWHLS